MGSLKMYVFNDQLKIPDENKILFSSCQISLSKVVKDTGVSIRPNQAQILTSPPTSQMCALGKVHFFTRNDCASLLSPQSLWGLREIMFKSLYPLHPQWRLNYFTLVSIFLKCKINVYKCTCCFILVWRFQSFM